MSVKFSLIMTVFDSFHFLPRALSCVVQQIHTNWELLIVVDGESPTTRFAPRRLVQQLRRHHTKQRIDVWELPCAEGCYGNVGRNFCLQHVTGDYICWINHDNLITPDYLAAHQENIEKTPACLSVVDIHLWEADRYRGRYPRRMTVSHIDLLCFAVPTQTARKVNAFGGRAERVYAADWLTFNACRKLLPIEHNHRLVGTHF